MEYKENASAALPRRLAYVEGLEKLIEARQRSAAQERERFVKEIFTDPETYRSALRDMLGWPLNDRCRMQDLPCVRSERIGEANGHEIFRVQVEILRDVWMSGLLFRIPGEFGGGKKAPFVLVQHGGLGTPEFIAGMIGDTTANYNDMLARVLRRGVHVFAPQLLLWDEKKYGPSYDRHAIDARLKRVGSSIAAVEVYGILQILKYYRNQPYTEKTGMVGMSWGGFYTLMAAALDTELQAVLSCSYFNERDRIPWCDWTWRSSALRFDDAEIACLIYPRPLTLAVGRQDPLFDYAGAEAAFQRLSTLCKPVGTDWVQFLPFDGEHEFIPDDAPIDALIHRLRSINEK